MADQALHLRSDADLEAALRAFGEDVAWPDAPSDLAASSARGSSPRHGPRAGTVALELVAGRAGPGGRGPDPARAGGPRRRRGLGLPGLRLILGPAPVSPPPSLAPSASPAAGVPGSTLGLGEQVPLEDLDARAGFDVEWPSDPALGPPDAAYIDRTLGGQVALVWRSRDGLPHTLAPGVGLIVTAFQGTTDSGFFSKAIGSGTTVKSVPVDVGRGFWLTAPRISCSTRVRTATPRPAAVGRRRPALDPRRDRLPAGDLARRGGSDRARRSDALTAGPG